MNIIKEFRMYVRLRLVLVVGSAVGLSVQQGYLIILL